MKLLALVLTFIAVVGSGCSGIEGGVRAYERGDYAAALVEFRPLADRGVRLAQYTLGLMYAGGHGVPQDYAEAVKWFGRAAAQGAPQAQFELGMLYARGQGVPQDFVLAHVWLNLAAASAESSDASYYATERDLLARTMTADQVARAQRIASESFGVAPPTYFGKMASHRLSGESTVNH